MELTFHGQYDRQTMQRALMFANRPTGKGMVLRLGILILLGIGLIYTIVDFVQNGGWSGLRAMRFVISFAAWVYVLLQPYLSARKIAAQFGEKEEKRGMIYGQIDRRGIRFNPGLVEKLVEWERFAGWIVNDDLAVLIMDDNNIYPFLQRFFRSDEEWKQFKLLLEDRIQVAK